MKRIIKNNVKIFIAVIIAIIITASGTVYAVTKYYADQVSFTPSDKNIKNGFTATNVEEALNQLYETQNDNLFLYWYGNTYDEITGGWKKSIPITKWGDGNKSSLNQVQATMNTNNIDFKTTDTFQVKSINTVNKIDCQNYKYFNIVYSMNNSYNPFFRFSKNNEIENYAMPDSTSVYYEKLINHKKVMMTSYPINCSEPGYLSVNTLRGNSSDQTTDLVVYGMYLSNDLK